MPSVLIRCDAGARHGLGHLVRSLTLAEAFREKGIEPKFICHDPTGIAASRIRPTGLNMLSSPTNAGTIEDIEVVQEALGDAPGIIIYDSWDTTEESLNPLRSKGLVVAIEDDVTRNMSVDVLINSNVWVSPNHYPSTPERVLLTGAQANLIRPEFFKSTSEQTEGSPLRVLITLGGEDPCNHTGMLLDYLGNHLRDTKTTVVIGPAHPQPEEVVQKVSELLPYGVCLVNPPDFMRYVSEADVAITAGGTTCYELAAAGVPMLGVAVEGHQKPMIDAMSNAGCLASLSDDQTLNRDVVISKANSLLQSQAMRQKMSKAARKIFQKSGAEYLAEQILQSFYLKCGNYEN